MTVITDIPDPARQTIFAMAMVPDAHAVMILGSAAFVLIFLGVILPSVWSRKPFRRRAAADILQRLLDFLRSGSRPR